MELGSNETPSRPRSDSESASRGLDFNRVPHCQSKHGTGIDCNIPQHTDGTGMLLLNTGCSGVDWSLRSLLSYSVSSEAVKVNGASG